MNVKTSAGACALSVFALSGCQTIPSADGMAEATAIRAQDVAWVAAIASKDPAKIASFYSDDAVFLPPNEDAKTGEAIRKAWADFVAAPGAKLTFAPTRIEVDQDGAMAIDVGTYEFSMDSPQGRMEDHGKYAQTWEKKDGVWKVAVDMYNSSVPLPPPVVPAAAPVPPVEPVTPAAPIEPMPLPKKKQKQRKR
jgi:uncharacterized protein (TIGR02246 family)